MNHGTLVVAGRGLWHASQAHHQMVSTVTVCTNGLGIWGKCQDISHTVHLSDPPWRRSEPEAHRGLLDFQG